MTRETLTSEQAAALERYARFFGPAWKASLRRAWETGSYPLHITCGDRALLQQVRNAHGPSWLVNAKVAL